MVSHPDTKDRMKGLTIRGAYGNLVHVLQVYSFLYSHAGYLHQSGVDASTGGLVKSITIYFCLIVFVLAFVAAKVDASDLPPSIQACRTDLECHLVAKKLCEEGDDYWCKVDRSTLWGAYDVVNDETDRDSNGWPDWMDDDSID